MKRRFLVEVDVVDTIPAATLEVVSRLITVLETLQKHGVLTAYGLALENELIWFLKEERVHE